VIYYFNISLDFFSLIMSLTDSRAHHPSTASHKRKRGYAEGGHIMLDLFDFIRSPPFRPPFSRITSTLYCLRINNVYANDTVKWRITRAVGHNDTSHIFVKRGSLMDCLQ